MTELDEYRIISEQIESLLLQREELMTTRNRITASLNGMPRAGNDPHKMDIWIDKLIAIDNELDKEIDKLFRSNAITHGLINKLPTSRMKNAMLFHYINGLSWQQTADRMNYSVQHIYKLRADAMKRIIKVESKCD
jgi:predicted DNA-binding protein YlxM (UPF0122 family)